MFRPFCAAALLLLPALSSHAGSNDCRHVSCEASFTLSSDSETKSYAILIAAPEVGCKRVRFRVETEAARFLGHTQALLPGELGIVRLGRGFQAGQHAFTILSEGCIAPPAVTRRVTLAKLSPDHGWRGAP